MDEAADPVVESLDEIRDRLAPIKIGDTFGDWEVVEKAAPRKAGAGTAAYWKCRCVCKRVKEVGASVLRRGLSLGCGCQRSAARRVDLTGQPFERWEVIGPGKKPRYWTCRCSCGTVKDVVSTSLTGRISRSCGCLRTEVSRATKTTHGLSHRPEWRVWWDMIARCYYPSNTNYERYGGRGIRITARWLGLEGFPRFLEDVGPRPTDDHSIDRRDNDGHYTPSNCRWATRVEQMANTRRTRFLVVDGRRLSVSGWAKERGVGSSTILARLAAGWTHEEAVNEPVRDLEERVLSHAGRRQSLREWAAELGVPYQTLYSRLSRKLPVWEILAEAGATPDVSPD